MKVWSGFSKSSRFPAKASFWRRHTIATDEKKPRDCSQVLDSLLLNSVVGREWLEHSTYGLRVRPRRNSPTTAPPFIAERPLNTPMQKSTSSRRSTVSGQFASLLTDRGSKFATLL